MSDVKRHFHWYDRDHGLMFGNAGENPVEYKHEKDGEDYVLATDYDAIAARVAKMRAALERLGSAEAFDVSRAIDPARDAELLARIDYARSALADRGCHEQ